MKFGVLFGFAVALSGSLMAVESPYVSLYRFRHDVAKANLERQKVNVTYDLDRRRRADTLYSRQAMSIEERNELHRRYELSVAEVAVMEKKVAEAAALVDVVKIMVDTGRPVPLCGGGEE